MKPDTPPCPVHRRYKAMRKPRVACAPCWAFYRSQRVIQSSEMNIENKDANAVTYTHDVHMITPYVHCRECGYNGTEHINIKSFGPNLDGQYCLKCLAAFINKYVPRVEFVK